MQTHNILWQVSLETGETYQEGKGKFEEIEGDLSPWNKLLEYLKETDTRITSLSLVNSKTGSTYNLPSMGKNPNFKPFREAQKPLFYGLMRCVAFETEDTDMGDPTKSEKKDWYTVIKAVYPEYSLQIWVNELNTKDSWTLVAKH